MKNITNYLSYTAGNPITPHAIYTAGDPIKVLGNVEFTVFGSVLMDGIRLTSRTYDLNFHSPVTLIIEKDSGILFNKSTQHDKQLPLEAIPVADVPEMQDVQTVQLHAMFDEWAVKQGLKAAPVTDDGDEILDGDMLDDDEIEYEVVNFTDPDEEVLVPVAKAEPEPDPDPPGQTSETLV